MDGEKKEALWEGQQWVTSPPSTVNPRQVLAVTVTPEGWRQLSASAQEPSAPQVSSCSSAGSWAQPFTLCHGPHASPRWGVRPCHAQEHNIPSTHQLPQLINCDARCEKAEPDLSEVNWGCRGVKEQTKKQQHSSAQCLLSPPGALWMPQCLCPPCSLHAPKAQPVLTACAQRLEKLRNHRQNEQPLPLQSRDELGRYVEEKHSSKKYVWVCPQPFLHIFPFPGPKNKSRGQGATSRFPLPGSSSLLCPGFVV